MKWRRLRCSRQLTRHSYRGPFATAGGRDEDKDRYIRPRTITPEKSRAYPVAYESYRRSLTRRFPYAVFYEYSEAKITVYAVFHIARDPDKWRQRLF